MLCIRTPGGCIKLLDSSSRHGTKVEVTVVTTLCSSVYLIVETLMMKIVTTTARKRPRRRSSLGLNELYCPVLTKIPFSLPSCRTLEIVCILWTLLSILIYLDLVASHWSSFDSIANYFTGKGNERSPMQPSESWSENVSGPCANSYLMKTKWRIVHVSSLEAKRKSNSAKIKRRNTENTNLSRSLEKEDTVGWALGYPFRYFGIKDRGSVRKFLYFRSV